MFALLYDVHRSCVHVSYVFRRQQLRAFVVDATLGAYVSLCLRTLPFRRIDYYHDHRPVPTNVKLINRLTGKKVDTEMEERDLWMGLKLVYRESALRSIPFVRHHIQVYDDMMRSTPLLNADVDQFGCDECVLLDYP